METTLRTLSKSFERHLLATNRSPRTVQTYLCALDALATWCGSRSLLDTCRVDP